MTASATKAPPSNKKLKVGDPVYWVGDSADSDDPVVHTTTIKQSSTKQITLTRTGPNGYKVYGVRDADLQGNNATDLFTTPLEAIRSYRVTMQRKRDHQRSILAGIERRLIWAERKLADHKPCTTCSGDGLVHDMHAALLSRTRPCPTCSGDGFAR